MSENSSGGGIGLFSAMFLIFLTLKLLGIIDWSWWMVTSPVWIPLCVGAFILGIYLLYSYFKEIR